MKTLQTWLSEYGESHQNEQNKRLHKICVPLIFWSVVALLWAWQLGPFRAIVPVALIALVFYFRLGWKIAVFMLVQIALSAALASIIDRNIANVVWLAVCVFIFAWIGQFYGHKIEGKKPSFFQDLQFLLIGPIWVFRSFLEKF